MWLKTRGPSVTTICWIDRLIEVRNLHLAICQAVSYWAFAALVRVQQQGSPYGICGGRSDTNSVFSEYLVFSPLSIIPPVLILIFNSSTSVAK